jgi:hypothetical protein
MSEEANGWSFDELAKGLASGTMTRRKALRLVGAAVVGGTLASVPGVAWAASNPKRCGSLGVCPGDTVCLQKGKNPQCGCPSPTQLCGTNQCVNTQTDSSNCGSCGNACAAGQSCQGGQCVVSCGSGTCPATAPQCCQGIGDAANQIACCPPPDISTCAHGVGGRPICGPPGQCGEFVTCSSTTQCCEGTGTSAGAGVCCNPAFESCQHGLSGEPFCAPTSV